MTYSIPIEVNESRGGKVTPRLALTYNSNAPQGPIGAGWSLPLSYVELDFMRRTPDGPDALDTAGLFAQQRFVYVEAGERHALLQSAPGEFRVAVESRFLLFTRVSEHWEAIDGASTRYVFRKRQMGLQGLTCRWYLTEMIDGNGNWARYVYRGPVTAVLPLGPPEPPPHPDFRQESDSFDLRGCGLLWGVIWNGNADLALNEADAASAKDQLHFIYEDRPDRQIIGDFGSVKSTTVRLKEVQVLSRDASGQLRRARTYHLGYLRSPSNLGSLLQSVQVTGAYCEAAPSGCPVAAVLPPTTFSYSTGILAVLGSATQTIRAASGAMPDHMGFQVIALPPPLDDDDHVIGGASSTRAAPIDLNGDGRSDLVTVDYPEGPVSPDPKLEWYFWSNRGGDTGRAPDTPFETRRNWETNINEIPAKDFSDLIDLNGDGRPDLVRQGWRVHFNNGTSFDDSAVQWEMPGLGTAAVACPRPFNRSDQILRRNAQEGLARTVHECMVRDLTGDGIPDYVRTDTGDPDLWNIYAGFIRGGSPEWPPRGGFTRNPIPWRIRRSTYPGMELFIHATRGWGHGASRTPSEPNVRPGDSYTDAMLADLNGDGLPDLLPRPFSSNGFGNSSREVLINTGRGFDETSLDIPEEVFAAYPHRRIYASKTESSSAAAPIFQTQGLLDVNGDGLPDLLLHRPGSDEALLVAFGTGAGFKAPHNWLTADSPWLRNLHIARWDKAGVRLFQRRGFLDLDGDGRLDYVQEARAAGWTALVGAAGPSVSPTVPDRLISIFNGIGGVLRTYYRPSTAFGQEHLPFVLDVVSQLQTEVQRDSTLVEPPAPSSFNYEGGRMWRHPDRGLWEYRGYSRVTQSRRGGNSTATTYAVSDPMLSGRPESRELRNAKGCRFQRFVNTWNTLFVPGGVRIPYLSKQEETHYDGTTCIASSARSRSNEILTVDNFGHALLQVDRGQSSGPEDDVYTATDYATGPSRRPVDLAWRVRVCRDAACSQPLSEVRYTYDGDPTNERRFLPLGQAASGGNLKTVTQLNYDLSDPIRAPEILELKRHTYGFRGNLTSSVVMHDSTEGTATTIEYDTRFQLLPVTTTTGLAAAGGTRAAQPFATRRTYDFVLGVAATETDPNGHVTFTTPDPFRRVVKVEVTRGPNREVVSDKQYLYDQRGAEVISRTYHSANRFDEEHSRYDGLGRLIRTWSPLGADVGNGTLEKKNIQYDTLGRPLVSFEPGRQGGPRLARYFFYDAQGRVETEVLTRYRGVLPSGAERTNITAHTFVTRHQYSLGSAGWTTSTFDANAMHTTVVLGPPSREVRDLRGRLVETADRAGSRITFGYDGLGQLNKATRFLDPPEGCASPCPAPVQIVLTVGHDSLGRTIWTNDPDRGMLRFQYDHAGRRTRSEMADVRTPTVFDRAVSYEYDLLGRMIGKRGLKKINGSWSWDGGILASFQYDSPVAGVTHPYPAHLLGRLASFTDATGTTFFGYDAQGHNTHLVKEFVGLPSGRQRFEVKHEFSPSGRAGVVDNGVERLELAYNTAGWLRSVSAYLGDGGFPRQVDFWNVQAFDDIGLPKRVMRADSNVVEEFLFNPETHRLEAHTAVGPRPSQGPLLSMSYSSYDALGNLLTMHDVRSRTDYSFGYDAAYRLHTARASNLAGGTGTPYNFLYFYDSLSNLREERDAVTGGGNIFGYRKDGLQPHATVEITPRIQISPTPSSTRLLYRYGNVLHTEQCVGVGAPPPPRCTIRRSFEYNAEDRLVRSADGGAVTTYGWDARGELVWQRLVRSDGSVTTVYSLGRWIDVIVEQNASGQIQMFIERHLWAGSQRIATRRNLLGSSEIVERHYLSDHLGSVSVVVDRFGELVARRDYLPFGKAAPTTAPAGRFGFNGQVEGLSGGLYLLGPRAYDPGLLRFLSADPTIPNANASIGYNRYAYAFNNPVNLVDPSGRTPLFAIFGVFLATVNLLQDIGHAIDAGDPDAAVIAGGFFAVRTISAMVGQAAGEAIYDDIVGTIGGGALNEAVATGMQFAVSSAFATLGQQLTNGKPGLGSLLKNVSLSAAIGFGIGAFYGGIRADLFGIDVTHNREVQTQLRNLESFYRNRGVPVDFSSVTVRRGGSVIGWLDLRPSGFAVGDTITLNGAVPLDASQYKFYSTMAHELRHVIQASDDFLMPVRYVLYFDTFNYWRIPYEVDAGDYESFYTACRASGACQ